MKKILKKILIIGILISVTIASAMLITAKILPANVIFEGKQIGGLKHEEARQAIEETLAPYRSTDITIVTYNNFKKTFTPQELGITYNSDATLAHIVRNTSFLDRVMTSVNASERTSKIKVFHPRVEFDTEKMRAALSSYLKNKEFKDTDAAIAWKEKEWLIQAEKSGKQLKAGEIQRIKNKIMQSSYPLKSQILITAAYQPTYAEKTKADLIPLSEKIERITAEPVELSLENATLSISFSDSPDWLIINEEQGTVELNEKTAREWIAKYANTYDMEIGKVLITGIEEAQSEYDYKTVKHAVWEGSFEKGREIDQEKLFQDLKALVADSQLDRHIKVDGEYINPIIESLVPGLQFPELISTGKSDYQLGNKSNRVTNVKLGLSFFDGVIIAPGEEFSFNRITGWVTEEKGYEIALILAGAVAVPGVGGGVCQVSTTVYRAAINAGLSIQERTPHSADVVYYNAYGHGLDATVYPPAHKDVRFINDTENPILVHTYTTEDEKAYVEFYGTSDGRTVEFKNIPTGLRLYKKWEQYITKDGETETRVIKSRYAK